MINNDPMAGRAGGRRALDRVLPDRGRSAKVRPMELHLAYTMAPGRGDIDLLLHRLATRLMAEGLRPCGTVQINSDLRCDGPCDMDVQVLPDGPVIRISQSLGPGAKGCRLDADALERAVAEVATRLDAGTDCLIVNKFGRHEAEGHGFRDVIAAALERGMPVLVGLNRMNAAALEDFTGGLAVELAPDLDGLSDWLRAAIARPAQPA